ncbi:MAG: integration host factor subunit beta [Puniceicoccales bacterium]|jgi:nucleoid DNA-binding protein|nr:integration host factor subunit beta [Puniceicoccales bacterium]
MGKNFTKKELSDSLHTGFGLAQRQAKKIVHSIFELLAGALKAKRNVEIRDFGVFQLAIRKRRVGRNPNKPEKDVMIPERVIVKFKCGKELREHVEKIPPSHIKNKK